MANWVWDNVNGGYYDTDAGQTSSLDQPATTRDGAGGSTNTDGTTEDIVIAGGTTPTGDDVITDQFGGIGDTSAEGQRASRAEFYDEFEINDIIGGAVLSLVMAAADELGEMPAAMESTFKQWQDAMNVHINEIYSTGSDRSATIRKLTSINVSPEEAAAMEDNMWAVNGTAEWYQTSEGLGSLIKAGFAFMQTKDPRLPDFDTLFKPGKTGTGRGRTRATPAEIRQQYDLDQLANQANLVWQSTLLTEHDDPRGVAHDYVEAVVATRAEQKIDFNTFVRKRAQETNRWASLYRNKPKAMQEEAYMAKYFQASQQVLRPNNAAGVAIGGAQFGSDAQTFSARLGRSNEVTTSAPFINGIQDRIGGLKALFKG